LYERDGDLDHYIPVGGTHKKIPRGNPDDYIGYIGMQVVRPDGEDSKEIQFEREWDFGDQESGNEEYRTLVHAYPEIRRDIQWSNEVRINLG